MPSSFRHRGLRYLHDAPFDAAEGQGTLAVAVQVDGVVLAAGTEVLRDIDFGYVVARLANPCDVLGVRLPASTEVHLYRANPRSLGSWLWLVCLMPLLVVLLLGLVLVLAPWELATGRWQPWVRPPGPGPVPIRAIAYLRRPFEFLGQRLQPGDSIAFYENGMLEPRRRHPDDSR